MNTRLRKQLQSEDPSQRRAAIIQLGQSGDQRALKALAYIAQHDTEPTLRQLAKRAGQHILRQQQQATASSASASVKANTTYSPPPPPPAPQVSTSPQPYRATPWGVRLLRRGVRLLAFGVGALLVTVGLVGGYLYTQGEFDRLLFDLSQAELQAFPETPPQDPTRALAGALYRGTVSPQMAFYVQEPSGTPPTDGWPVVVGLYDALGNDQDMLYWGREVPQAGILWVTAYLSPTEPGNTAYSGSAISEDLKALLARLAEHYQLNPEAQVLLGYGLGGSAAGLHAVYHPSDFAGYVLLDADQYPDQLAESSAAMLIMWTADSPTAEAARAAIQRRYGEGRLSPDDGLVAGGEGQGISREAMAQVIAFVEALVEVA